MRDPCPHGNRVRLQMSSSQMICIVFLELSAFELLLATVCVLIVRNNSCLRTPSKFKGHVIPEDKAMRAPPQVSGDRVD